MANLLNIIFQKKSSKKKNLTSFYKPYEVLEDLLKNHEVSNIIDAGASNGRISKRLLNMFPKAFLHAFEPNPLYEQTLNKFASEDSRFLPNYIALSDHKGYTDFCITESPGNASLFKPGTYLKEIDSQGSLLKNTKKVEIISLDEWLQQNGNPAVQLIKMDIQGAELLVLQGAENALKNSVIAVYTEILFNSLYDGGALFSEIDLCLRTFGFVLYDIYKPKYNSSGLLMYGNAIYLHNKRFNG
ncbi:MAG: FkbM family methyltransferase [Proteobacteria bacterium]|nr:FkbM family methyltransferase [Pseudomonadota bacterium]MBU4011024.1 FkbM family methyltransferase [Pseudomonadota bacterium]